MFKCREIAQLASDYLNKDLSLRQRVAFKLHLFLCHNCHDYVFQLKTTINSIRMMPEQQPLIIDGKVKNLAKLLRENAGKK